jgi:hypothetical protein
MSSASRRRLPIAERIGFPERTQVVPQTDTIDLMQKIDVQQISNFIVSKRRQFQSRFLWRHDFFLAKQRDGGTEKRVKPDKNSHGQFAAGAKNRNTACRKIIRELSVCRIRAAGEEEE